jgi:hypothetical protein
MKAYWGSGGIAPFIHSLTSALDGGEWSFSRTDRFNPSSEKVPGTHWIGSWVGPRETTCNDNANTRTSTTKKLL